MMTYKKKWRIKDMLDSIGVTDTEIIEQAYRILKNMTYKQLRFIEIHSDFIDARNQRKTKKQPNEAD